MFKAIGRYFRALGYLVTGRIDEARRTLSQSPYVVRATYDRIISEKKQRIQQYKDAVARMIAQQEKKTARIKQLTEEVNKLEMLKEGAAAKARLVINDLKSQGVDEAQMRDNVDYQKCMTAFNDFSSTVNEKNGHITELEGDVGDLTTNINSHKVQLQQLLRELDKIKDESNEAVADIITATEEKEIADIISGISNDRTGQELEEMRELRAQAKANARVSRELAGTETKSQEAEFMDYARRHATSSEFDKLIGLAGDTDANERDESSNELLDKPEQKTQLPEQ